MHRDRLALEKLALELGVQTIPESWKANWEAYEEWLGADCDLPSWQIQPNAQKAFDLPEESLSDLESIYAAIRADECLRQLADFWHYLIYHLPAGMERNTNVWNLPDAMLGCSTRAFSLAAMISGPEHARQNFAATGVSDQVIYDTLGYIGRYARDIRAKRGVWGLESLGWLSTYVRANIFRLGRLTFKSGTMGQPFRAYKNRRSGEVAVLCDGGRYRQDGLADGTNDTFDPNPWTPTVEVTETTVSGHPISCEASALSDTVELRTDEWEQAMGPGDDIVEVHVAGGSRLSAEECADSYRQALNFFPGYYPNARFTGFTIWSWLLDPSLAKILPPESNIVQFQRDFHQLPVSANEAQAYDLVFGDSKADPTTFACKTSIQQAIADYVRAGGKLRSTGGIITWSEAREIAKRAM